MYNSQFYLDDDSKIEFTEVYVPKLYIYDTALNSTRKILLSMFLYIEKTYGNIVVSGRYLSSVLGLTQSLVSREIRRLEDMKYIKTTVFEYKNAVLGKRIYVLVKPKNEEEKIEMDMKLHNITLVRCQSEYDFKEVKEGVFQALVKANNNAIDSIVLIEMNKEQYDYISQFNKDDKINISGYMQIRKNKKGIPFLFLQTTKVGKSVEKKAKQKKKNIFSNPKNISWKEEIKKFNYEVKELDSRDIKFIDDEHLKSFSLYFSKKNINEFINRDDNNEVNVAVKPIKDSNKYELIVGWREVILSKLFEKEVKCYIVDKSREEFVKEIISADGKE